MKLLPLLLLPLLCLLSLLWGSADVTPADVWRALASGGAETDTAAFIVRHLRLPAMLTALTAGCALAASGLVMQTVFANPLADPSLLGVNAGAGLGAAVAMLLFGGGLATGVFSLTGRLFVFIAACVGAGGVIVLLLFFSSLFRSNLRLLVAGVMVSFVASSLITVLGYFASASGLQGYVLWGMGDFSSLDGMPLVVFMLLTVLLLGLLACRVKTLNALLLGADYAVNLGIDVRRARTLLLLLTGVLSAAVTALCGPVSFIGLAAPHVARYVHRTADHRRLFPLTLLWGADIALMAALCIHLPGGVLLPLNAVTPFFGVPIVLALIMRPR